MFLNTFHLFYSLRKYRKSELQLDKLRYLSAAILYIITFIFMNMTKTENNIDLRGPFG